MSKLLVDEIGGNAAAATAIASGKTISGTAAQFTITGGSSGEFLSTDGSGGLSFASAAAGLNSIEVFTSSGTWTKPTGVTKIIVEVQGGGGSGSRHPTGANVCSGAGGGYARKFLDVTDIDTVSVVVGAGGASQTSASTAGVDGGLSSFIKATGSGSFTDIVGNGGTGGIISGWGAGPIGGTGTGGDLNIQGGRGWMGGDGTNHAKVTRGMNINTAFTDATVNNASDSTKLGGQLPAYYLDHAQHRDVIRLYSSRIFVTQYRMLMFIVKSEGPFNYL